MAKDHSDLYLELIQTQLVVAHNEIPPPGPFVSINIANQLQF